MTFSRGQITQLPHERRTPALARDHLKLDGAGEINITRPRSWQRSGS